MKPTVEEKLRVRLFMPKTSGPIAAEAPGPLLLLMRASLVQNWRRLKSLKEQSRLLVSIIALFIFGYVSLSFWLFYRGLNFVGTFPGLGTVLTERLLFLLFAFLFGLLLLSNLIISYTNFFRNRETAFLMALPLSAQTIFRWKFIESTLLASWAFVFLVSPLLAAYGLTHKAGWYFYPITLALVMLFIVLPAVGGSWLAVNVARYLDRRTFQVALLAIALLLVAGAALWLKPEVVTDESLETRVLTVLDRLLAKTRFAQFPLLPSYWLSAGVLNWSEGALRAACFFLLVLLSHVLFFGFLVFNGMGDLFYDAASIVQSRGGVFHRWGWSFGRSRAKVSIGRLGPVEIVLSSLRWLRPDLRALLAKDVRMFWRDTAQWGQTIMLFGLLGVYILNLRHFSQQLNNPFWVHLISYLNLGACSLNLATLTTRFVFPQFSLEGKRLWIVGMAPLGLPRIIKAKFWLSGCASLIVTLGLIFLSCYMLRLPFERTLYFSCAVTVMTFSLTGLALGLGVLYPNFKEENPSKIVSGFGGAFCLVLSFLYILSSVILLAIGSPWAYGDWQTLTMLLSSWAAFMVLSFLLGWLPLKIGLRRVASFEL